MFCMVKMVWMVQKMTLEMVWMVQKIYGSSFKTNYGLASMEWSRRLHLSDGATCQPPRAW
jgi:hypothetical protein